MAKKRKKPSKTLKRRNRAIREIGDNRIIKRRPLSLAKNLKFTRRRRSIIFKGVENRLPLGRAAALAGVTQKTVYLWMSHGKDPEKYPIHYIFRKKVKKIQAQIEQESLDIIREAGRGGAKIIDTTITFGPKGTEIKRRKKILAPSWGAAAWFLERRFHKDYGNNITDIEAEKTAEEFAMEIRDAAKALFESVPIFPVEVNEGAE